ncbi:MAG: hypothetical protein NTV19_19050 [Burkholderiales bacterium]|nr:hypothetical protein [Burkholderiales bacterium]
MFDLLISNAKIYDGLGSEPFEGQVAVKDGRIAAVRRRDAPIDASQARENIDAAGQSLMPGIIDNPMPRSPGIPISTSRSAWA